MPAGYDNMFFALFGITNRAVSCSIHLEQTLLRKDCGSQSNVEIRE